MTNSEKPWWLSVDRWALALFTCASMLLSGKNMLRFFGIILAVSFLFKYYKANAKWHTNQHPPELYAYTIWGIWAGLSGLLVCSSFQWFWINYRIVLQMIVMIWTIYGLLRLNMSNRLVYWCIVFACLAQIIAIALGYSFEKTEGIIRGEVQFGEDRVHGLTSNANTLGFLMIAGISCVMQLWQMKHTFFSYLIKISLILFMLVAIFVTWQTGSRKTSAAMAFMVIGWLVWILPQGKVILRIFFIIVMLIIGTSMFTFVSDETVVGKRFNQLFDYGGGSFVVGVEEDVRTDMYKEGLQMFLAHPVAGVGLGHFVLYYWKGAYSHSDYIEPLACTGLVGFIMYHCFNLFLFLRILRLQKMVRDRNERYLLNVILLSLITSLLLGLGAPFWSSQRQYLLLTTFVTYTWMLERRLRGIALGMQVIQRRGLTGAVV